jgi:hypothetical protein
MLSASMTRLRKVGYRAIAGDVINGSEVGRTDVARLLPNSVNDLWSRARTDVEAMTPGAMREAPLSSLTCGASRDVWSAGTA